MQVIAAAIAVLFVLLPRVATGQTSAGADPFSVQLAGGRTVVGGGSVLSAAFGYSPASWLELLLNVERDHLPFQSKRYRGGYSVTRGGTMTFGSGELRFAMVPAHHVSPFALAGIGRGVSRPNVNAESPDRVTNDLRVLYFGGGVRVRLRGGLSLLTDARATLALEDDDTVIGVWPVRAGVAWRF
jgi:hypothetical protein